MHDFPSGNGAIITLFFRIIAEVAGYHEEKRNGKTADRLYDSAKESGELAMHENYANASDSLDEIQTTVILFHHSPCNSETNSCFIPLPRDTCSKIQSPQLPSTMHHPRSDRAKSNAT